MSVPLQTITCYCSLLKAVCQCTKRLWCQSEGAQPLGCPGQLEAGDCLRGLDQSDCLSARRLCLLCLSSPIPRGADRRVRVTDGWDEPLSKQIGNQLVFQGRQNVRDTGQDGGGEGCVNGASVHVLAHSWKY